MMRFPRWLVPAVLASGLLLSLLQLFDAHHVWYFPMIHGLAYSLRFNLGFSLVPALLPISATILVHLLKEGRYGETLIATSASIGLYLLFGTEAAVAWFSIFQIALALRHIKRIGEFLFWLLAFMTGFEATALIHWALLPFGIVTPLAWFADLELAIFYILAPLAPLFVLTMILIVTLKLFTPRYLTLAGQFSEQIFSSKDESTKEIINLHPKTLLIISLVLSVVGALYPYNRNINPEGTAFGVDVHHYIDWMEPVNQGFLSAFTVANGSRPIILLVIYGIQHGLGLKLLDAIKYLPVLLNPLLVLSVYFMVSQATGDGEWAGLASLFTASGFNIAVGMYAYFLTNMLGLIFLFSSLGFLFKTFQTGKKVYFVSASGLGSLLVFTHPWTFIQYYAAIVLFLIYIYFKENKIRESIVALTYLGLLGLVDVLKGVIGGLEAYGAITSTVFGLVGIGEFWGNNIFAFRQMYGGLLSNTIFLGFAVFGVYLLNRRKPYHLFLTLLLLVSLTFYLMVNGGPQTKLLYNIPFSVLASLGILFLFRGAALDRRKKMIICNYIFLVLLITFGLDSIHSVLLIFGLLRSVLYE